MFQFPHLPQALSVSGNRMKTAIKKIFPYFLTSIFVVGLWWFLTRTDNYAWFPKGKETLILDIALISIFYYKTLFWLVITNVTVFVVSQLLRKNYKTTAISALFVTVFYIVVGQVVDKKCAFHYYSVFQNQSVSEDYIDKPILKAGYQIVPIVTENIADKQMKYRRYAIVGLEKIKYKPATPTLTRILLDKSELEVFRADAYQVLTSFDTDEAVKILNDFKNEATDPLDKKVVELGEYFIKNN